MDNQSEEDYHNFSQTQSVSAHRLPTVIGTQALFDSLARYRPIPTGLAKLDATLHHLGSGVAETGGIPRGRLTEVYGPPGAGKTQFGLQLAANALKADASNRVTWIDTSSRVPGSRLRELLRSADKSQLDDHNSDEGDVNDDIDGTKRFDSFEIRSLPHLVAVFNGPPTELISGHTCLLIIDSISNAVTNGLPSSEHVTSSLRPQDFTGRMSKEEIVQRAAAQRRATILGGISSALARLAASRNLAVVVLDKVSTSRRNGAKIAMLRPTLDTQQWTESVSTRIALYRDFWHEIESNRDHALSQNVHRNEPLRIAEVERAAYRNVKTTAVRFVISKAGFLVSTSGSCLTDLKQTSLQAVERLSSRQKAMGTLTLSSHKNLNSNTKAAALDANVVDRSLQKVEDKNSMFPPARPPMKSPRDSSKFPLHSTIPDSQDPEGDV